MNIKLNWGMRVEVRRYPSLDDSSVFDAAIYWLGATVRDADGVSCLALERTTANGKTEVLRIRLLSPLDDPVAELTSNPDYAPTPDNPF